MKPQIIKYLAALMLASVTLTASAVPYLQLDIIGGYYDEVDETIVSKSSIGTLVAYGGGSHINSFDLGTDYFISIALLHRDGTSTGPDLLDFGSFEFGGVTYDMNDVVYGVPPLEANLAHDAGDLSKHGIYPTLFAEYKFKFDVNLTSASVNTAEDTGIDPFLNPGDDLYYKLFDVDMTNMHGSYGLHFDLYNTKIITERVCVTPPKPSGWQGKWKPAPVCTTTPTGDIDRNDFAPFSHDAYMVPEPGMVVLFLLGIGLVVLSVRQRQQV